MPLKNHKRWLRTAGKLFSWTISLAKLSVVIRSLCDSIDSYRGLPFTSCSIEGACRFALPSLVLSLPANSAAFAALFPTGRNALGFFIIRASILSYPSFEL